MEKFFLDEKYDDFLLLAQKDNNRAYAFRHKDEIVYLEDLPDNYPSITICIADSKDLRKKRSNLINNGFTIYIWKDERRKRKG